jgi:hypothetical protein
MADKRCSRIVTSMKLVAITQGLSNYSLWSNLSHKQIQLMVKSTLLPLFIG